MTDTDLTIIFCEAVDPADDRIYCALPAAHAGPHQNGTRNGVPYMWPTPPDRSGR